MAKYIFIKDKGNGSKERATELSRELYKLSRPNPDPKDVTKYLLPVIVHPVDGAACLKYDDTTDFPCSPDMDATKLKEIIADDANGTEKTQLENYLKDNRGSRVLFKNIIPSGVQIRTHQWMVQNGWLEE